MRRISESPHALRRLLVAAAAGIAAILSCGREPTRPSDAGSVVSQGIAFAVQFPDGFPQFQAAGGSGVSFATVHIVLRHPDGTAALDTVVTFPPGVTELPVTLSVRLPASAPASGLPLALTLDYVNAGGVTVFHGGPVTVIAVPRAPGAGPPPPAPVTIPIAYTGPGANAVAVRISPRTLTANTGAPFAFSATAVDAAGATIANTPVVFSADNPVLAPVNAATGAGVAGPSRGRASITAQLLTGPADTATLIVVAPPAALALVSGGGQAANVNAPLPSPVVVKVTATDGGPAAGVAVAFAAQNGGAVDSANVATDANGLAQTTWKLGPVGGVQTLTAEVAGLAGSPVTVTATARALAAVRLAISAPPPTTTAAGAGFGLAASALDATGALAPPFTGAVTVALGADAPPGARLSGTTTVNAVAGVATFTDLALNVPGTYTLGVSAPGLAGATTPAFTVTAGAAAKLVFHNYPIAGAQAGAAFDVVTVVAQDALGNRATTFTGAVTVDAVAAVAASGAAAGGDRVPPGSASATTNAGVPARPVGGTPARLLGGTTTVNAVDGAATFVKLSQTTAGSWTLVASSPGLTSVTGPTFAVTPGPAAAFVLVSGGGQTAPAGTPLPAPVVVRVTDLYGNGVSGVAVNFTPAAGSGTVLPSSAVSGSGGAVQTVWTLGTPGLATLNVASGAVPAASLAVTATASGQPLMRTWTGAIDSAWTTPGNWSPAGAPRAVDSVTVAVTAKTPTITTPTAVQYVQIGTCATLNNLSVLTVGGDFLDNSYLCTAERTSPGWRAAGSRTPGTGGRAYSVQGLTGMLILAGTGSFQGIVNNDVLVAGGVRTLSGRTSVAGILSVSGPGQLVVGAQQLYAGKIATVASGTISMLSPSAQLVVAGSAVFAGGAETGLLTAGVVQVGGDFSASGLAYDATPAHTLELNAGTLPQTLTFTSPVAGHGIGTLLFSGAGGKSLTGNVPVLGTVAFRPTSAPVVAPGATARIGGDLRDSTLGGGWFVQGTEFTGSPTVVASAIASNLTVSGGTALLGYPLMLLAGNVDVTGPAAVLDVNGKSLEMVGNFRTLAGGKLKMTNALDEMEIRGNATFAGGSTAGLLTDGDFVVHGDLIQAGGAPDAYAAGPFHDVTIGASPLAPGLLMAARARGDTAALARVARVAAARVAARAAAPAGRYAQRQARRAARAAARGARLGVGGRPTGGNAAAFVMPVYAEPLTHTISLANPGVGPGTSHLGSINIAGANVQLGSSVDLTGDLETGDIADPVAHTMSGAGYVVTSHGADIYSLRFDNVRWVLFDSSSVVNLVEVSFVNMDPAVDQFTVRRDGTLPLSWLDTWTFGTVPTTGRYINALDTDGIVPYLDLPMVHPRAVQLLAHALTAGGATITVLNNLWTWTGTVSTDWSNPANWDRASVPTFSSDVLVPSAPPFAPKLTAIGITNVRSLVIQNGGSLNVNNITLAVSDSLITGATGGLTGCGTTQVQITGPFARVRGNTCGLYMAQAVALTGRVSAAGTVTVDSASGVAILTLAGNTLDVAGRLDVLRGHGIQMTDPRDSVIVRGDASFGGGTSTLTNGTVVVSGNFTQTGTASFAASGAHTTSFPGRGTNTVVFASPAVSFFQNVTVDTAATLFLNSDVTVKGTFGHGPFASASSVATTASPGAMHTLTAAGLAGWDASRPVTFTNVALRYVDGVATSPLFNNATFSGFAPTATRFEVARSGGSYTFAGLTFSGSYVGGLLLNVTGLAPTVTITGATPATGVAGVEWAKSAGATVFWP